MSPCTKCGRRLKAVGFEFENFGCTKFSEWRINFLNIAGISDNMRLQFIMFAKKSIAIGACSLGYQTKQENNNKIHG